MHGLTLPRRSNSAGNSLPEVLIASAILALVVSISVGSLVRSGKIFSKSRERDAISTLIAKDLETVRSSSFNYMRCDPTPQPGEPANCPAARDNSFSDGQITFVPGAARCKTGTLAEGLIASDPTLTATSSLLVPQTLSGVSLKGVTITRSIKAGGNELIVKYSTNSTVFGNQPIYQQTLIVPESTGWCP
jgi:hypothetical protein